MVKAIHGDRLIRSSADCKKLVQDVESGFLTVCGLYGQKHGNGVSPPMSPEIRKAMVGYREAAVRHKQGDYHHKPSEWQAMKVIAQWTIDVNCELRGQPHKVLDHWRDEDQSDEKV